MEVGKFGEIITNHTSFDGPLVGYEADRSEIEEANETAYKRNKRRSAGINSIPIAIGKLELFNELLRLKYTLPYYGVL